MDSVLKRISETGVIPVIVIDDPEDAPLVANALCEGGLPCAEITFRTAAAAKAIGLISKQFPGMLLGAGTVLAPEQADQAVAAGASFIVSPGLNPKTHKHCKEKGILSIPGVSTPSDIEAALALGIDSVKFFPAELCGGLKAIKALSGPFPTVRFIPTGGVNIGNLGEYLAHPKVLACCGSWIVDKKLIAARDFAGITERARQAVAVRDGKQMKLWAAQPVLPPDSEASSPPRRLRVVTFGEIMLRLSPEGYNRFIQTDRFGAVFGGGEANVAVSLANFNIDAAFVTKLPDSDIGQAAINNLRRYGVDTSMIIRGGNRVGIYYLEKGASQRPSKVIYDRAGSAIAQASAPDFDWSAILNGAKWFHFTGITPALGDKAAAICLEACRAARALGVTVSCDLNFRKNLWAREKAEKVMSELCKHVNICIANEEDAKDVFGIEPEDTDLAAGAISREGFESVARRLTERFGFDKTAITLRGSISASDNDWGAMLFDGSAPYYSRNYRVHIVDRVGGGDSFAAGLIYAFLNDMPPQEAVEFAAAASCLKHSIEGDYNLASLDEVRLLAGGNASGRISR